MNSMHNDAIVPLWALGLKGVEFVVWVVLSSLCGMRREHLVSIEDAAKMCRYSVNRTRRIIESLDARGFIVTKPSIRRDGIYCTVVYVDPNSDPSDMA